MVTVTRQCSMFLIVTVTLMCSAPYGHVTLQCSVILMVTDTLKCSAPYAQCRTAVFSVPNFHCHFEVFSSLWSLSNCSVLCS